MGLGSEALKIQFCFCEKQLNLSWSRQRVWEIKICLMSVKAAVMQTQSSNASNVEVFGNFASQSEPFHNQTETEN